MEGIVKWFDRKKGFGFIAGDDGKDYFVHYTTVAEGVFIRENDKVSFEPIEGDKGMQAKDVQLLQKGSEMQQEEKPAEEEQTEEEAPKEEPKEETEEKQE